MNDLLERLGQAIERFLRGSAFSRVLTGCGIDPRRYWLLMDLFAKLSEREEMQGQLGRQTGALRFSAGLFFILGSGGALVMVMFGTPVRIFISIYLFFTAFILLGVLLSETANSLVNPVEGLALAHQPINGATYTGAKLSHLLRVVLYFAGGLNLTPALAGAFLRDAPWSYPLIHFGAASLSGLVLALACCGIFGWLIRVVPARRLKVAAQFVQSIPFVIIMTRQAWMPAGRAAVGMLRGTLQWIPVWAVIAAAAAALGTAVVFGLRALSSDYLIRVSAMVHSNADIKTKVRWSLLGEIVHRFFGGQAGRAGFEYMRRMMLRDWQFRRQLLTVFPLLFFAIIGLANDLFSKNPSPFSAGFSSVHLLPHLFGIMLLSMCVFLQYGTDYKGVWLFLTIPDHMFRRVARGIHASLWLTVVLLPHALLWGPFMLRWGISEASLFMLYSVAAVSVYLAIGLRLIEGIPFGKQPNPSRSAGMQFGMIVTLILVGIAVAIQYLIFRSYIAVEILIPILWGGAHLLTRNSLRSFDLSIRHNLALESGASKLLYTEVETE